MTTLSYIAIIVVSAVIIGLICTEIYRDGYRAGKVDGWFECYRDYISETYIPYHGEGL